LKKYARAQKRAGEPLMNKLMNGNLYNTILDGYNYHNDMYRRKITQGYNLLTADIKNDIFPVKY
jgi:hypothetical protein